jgi:hypothetical protein
LRVVRERPVCGSGGARIGWCADRVVRERLVRERPVRGSGGARIGWCASGRFADQVER